MTDIIVKQHGEPDKKVKTLTINFAGEDGEMMWLEIETEDGKKIQTPYFKGTY